MTDTSPPSRTTTATRPNLYADDTFDATRLKGSLSQDGTATLHSSEDTTRADRYRDQRSGSADYLDTAISSDGEEDKEEDEEEEDVEDYDDLQLDPDTLIVNTRRSMEERKMEDTVSTTKKEKKRRSIQIRLERTDKKGRYVLTADDPEIKEILRKGIEREQDEAKGRKPRMRFRDLVFTRQFTTFDRQNPASAESPFFGFFTLFWICMFLIFVQVALRNWRDYGSILGENQVMNMMFSRDIVVLGITDGIMFGATFEAYLFQRVVKAGYINWSSSGWIIQNIWQSTYLGAIIGWAYFRDWPWTHTIFVCLHGLVFLMKMHSYAFYNGYLSGVHRRRVLLEEKLKDLEALEPLASAPNSPSSPRGSFNPSSGIDLAFDPHSMIKRRPSTGPRTNTNFEAEKSDVSSVAAAIESGHPISHDQMVVMSNIIKHEIAELDKDLLGKADTAANSYPNNITFSNFADYICLPTLVYELAYPRQEKINWWYVAEKTTATFGVLCVMQVVSQGFIYPLVAKTNAMKTAGLSLEQRWQEFPFIVSDMLFPMLIEQLLTWYLIWECILNVLAEVTRFADRGFYGDWWNSVTWDQYARDWNRPVHNFLLRHVYHSSISTLKLSRGAATFATFLLSALVHEMCMAVIFKKVRGYLFWMQLLQMPLVAFSRSKIMKGRVVLGNTVFWIGLFIGPAVLTSLYLVI